jgi:uncharacterized membrane protein
MFTPPRPPWLLTLHAIVVILICLAVLGCSVWALIAQYHPLFALAAPLMLCVPPLIAAMQYRAVFRHNENAARNVGKYLFVAGGLLAIFFAVMTYIYATNAKPVETQGLRILVGVTAACLYLLLCGHANGRWAKQLQDWEENNAIDEPQ